VEPIEYAPSLNPRARHAALAAFTFDSEWVIKEIDMATSKESGKGAGSSSGSAQKGGSGSGQGPAKRGFAAMDQAQQREIASKGGQAAHQKGTAHEFDSEEARRAGQKGGEAVSRNRAHMADIGRKGGESRQSAQRAAQAAATKGNRQGGDKE
jgi:general stress protein YciG